MSAVQSVWECPKCGTEMIGGHPGIWGPPTCACGHAPVEMEQKLEREEHAEALPEGSSE